MYKLQFFTEGLKASCRNIYKKESRQLAGFFFLMLIIIKGAIILN